MVVPSSFCDLCRPCDLVLDRCRTETHLTKPARRARGSNPAGGIHRVGATPDWLRLAGQEGTAGRECSDGPYPGPTSAFCADSGVERAGRRSETCAHLR